LSVSDFRKQTKTSRKSNIVRQSGQLIFEQSLSRSMFVSPATLNGKQQMAKASNLSAGLTGVAGEYFVAAELSRLGYIATLTLKNTRGIDILAANLKATKSTSIQVKTNQGRKKEWTLHQKAEDLMADNLFYVFVLSTGQKICLTCGLDG
jgi:hypothetical protein